MYVPARYLTLFLYIVIRQPPIISRTPRAQSTTGNGGGGPMVTENRIMLIRKHLYTDLRVPTIDKMCNFSPSTLVVSWSVPTEISPSSTRYPTVVLLGLSHAFYVFKDWLRKAEDNIKALVDLAIMRISPPQCNYKSIKKRLFFKKVRFCSQ